MSVWKWATPHQLERARAVIAGGVRETPKLDQVRYGRHSLLSWQKLA
jgi:hypothetical protein